MKIHPDQEILRIGAKQQARKSDKSGGKEFGSILKDTITNASKTEAGVQKASVLQEAAPVQSILSPVQGSDPNIERIERLIDTLDRYQQKLNSPHASLKELYPLIQEIEREQQALTPTMDALSDEDDLKGILKEVLLTSSMEAIRFNRGDYIDS